MPTGPTVSAAPSGVAEHPILHIAFVAIVIVAVLVVFLIVRRRRS